MSSRERGEKMKEAVDYLNSTPYFAQKSSLENIRNYLERFGHPEKGMKIIHVAGTNGKGSVCARIASCLREAGYHVGLFISPHLEVIRERMSIDGEMISEEEFLDCFEKVKTECVKSGEDALPHLLYSFEMNGKLLGGRFGTSPGALRPSRPASRCPAWTPCFAAR